MAIITRRLRMPYTVGLVLAGIGLHFFPGHLDLQLSKELIYSVFLPPLVFEAALYISWRELRQDLPVIGLLASVGVLLAATLTAIGMHYAAGWSWAAASVFPAPRDFRHGSSIGHRDLQGSRYRRSSALTGRSGKFTQ